MYKRITICILAVLFIILLSGCDEDELGVYSLCTYEDYWKGNICVDAAYDPYQNFWNIMTSGADPNCADPSTSRRYRNHEVVIQTIIPVPGDDRKCWDDFDLVFFYGHHNTIVPPHPHSWFGYSNYTGGSWVSNHGWLDTIGWGHTTAYDYYPTRPITNADDNPGAVTYLYNKYTSSLLGGAYDYGGGNRPWQEHWNDTVQHFNYGELGDLDLEWLILYGCQAVITANEDGSYNNLALRCFCPVSGKYHIIMGHYISYSCSNMKSLDGFANDLLGGVRPIQCAYFDTAPERNSSAIAAEQSPFPGWAASTMVNDKWRNPVADVNDACCFTMRWLLPLTTPPSPSPSPTPNISPDQAEPGTESRDPQKLDKELLRVESPAARELLKHDQIKIRDAYSRYIPSGSLPVLKLEPVDDGMCKKQLTAVSSKIFQTGEEELKLKRSGGSFAFQADNVSGWINRGSGSYKLDLTNARMTVPSKFDNFREPLQKALHFIGENRLVEPVDGEEIDVLFVSVVNNAVAVVEDKGKPTVKYKKEEEFKSDYYVGFGRRFNGVPVVGSRLVVRLEGDGDVVMVQKNWRRIVEVRREKAEVGDPTIQSLRASIVKVAPRDIHIQSVQAGYMEAPGNYEQESLRPGAMVTFKVGKVGEGFSQIMIPLEKNVKAEALWGKPVLKR